MTPFTPIVELWIDGAWVDVSARARRSPPTISMGQTDESALVNAATASVVLDNTDGALSVDNPASAWWPHIRRGMLLRLSMSDGVTTWERLTGEVRELRSFWPLATPRGGDRTGVARVEMTVAGVLRTLRQGEEALESALWRYIMSEDLVDAYWPCEQGTVARGLASSPIEGVRPAPYILQPDADDTLPGSKLVGAADGGAVWGFNFVIPPLQTATRHRVLWMMRLPEMTSARRVMIVQVAGAPITRYELRISTTEVIVRSYDGDTTDQTVTTSHNGTVWDATGDVDGWRVWELSREVTTSGTAGAVVRWYSVATGLPLGAMTTSDPGPMGRLTHAQNLSTGGPSAGVSLAHLWVTRTNLIGPSSPARGHLGETAGGRFERLCAEEGIAATVIGNPDDSEPMGPQRPEQFLGLLTECAEADRGVIFEQGQGLAFRTRASILNQDTAVTLDVDQAGLLDPFEAVDDDQRLVNDVTADRPDGSSARVVDDMSVKQEGRYRDPVTVNVEGDDQLGDQASWRVHLGTWPEQRHPNVETSLRRAGSAVRSDFTALTIGDRVALRNLMRQHARDGDVVTRGWEETLSAFDWLVQLHTRPYGPYDVGTLDADSTVDTGLPRLDTSGSSLAVAVDDDDTTLRVVIDDESDEWTQDTDHMPFDVEVGGERVTVTAVTAVAGDLPVVGEGDQDTTASTSHVAPSVTATDNGLVLCAWTSHDAATGSYTVPGSMTQAGTETTGDQSVQALASETLGSSGATGTRTATNGNSVPWSACSLVVHGVTASPVLSFGTQSTLANVTALSHTLGLGSLEAGDWLLLVRGVDWDPADALGPPDNDSGMWTLAADSGITPGPDWADGTSRTQMWVRRVTEGDDGTVSVTLTRPESAEDNHGRLFRVTGVGGVYQDFTVVRSVNDVTKPHAVGASVRVASPLRLT